MLRKKDITNVALWTSIIDLALASTVAITTSTISQNKIRTVARVGFNSMISPTVAGLIEGGHLASMRHTYNRKDLQILECLVLGISCATFATLNAYNSSTFEDMDVAKCALVGVLTGFAITLQTFSAIEIGSNLHPLKFPDIAKDRKEEAALKLKEVLSYDGSSDKDIFETLERYNKVYKKMFTTLGTPYEMARITNNNDIAKKIGEKNHQLVLQALLDSKFARDNAMSICK